RTGTPGSGPPRSAGPAGSTRSPPSHRLEGAEALRHEQVDTHDHDGNDGERGGEGDVARDPHVLVHDVPDEARPRPPYQERRDEVAEGQGEREDGPGDTAGE